MKDGVGTMKQGEQMATQPGDRQRRHRRCGQRRELRRDSPWIRVVAVRDKVIQAYQSIMQMPI